MRRLVATKLETAAFAPFGEVTARAAAQPGTVIVPVGPQVSANLRPDRAQARLGWFVVPASAWPVPVQVMERHRFSSQSFVPTDAVNWLVLVAPHDAEGGPAMDRAQAFLAGPDHAVTLRPDVWHHPLTAFAPAGFAVVTSLAGDSDDEEFCTIAPLQVVAP